MKFLALVLTISLAATPSLGADGVPISSWVSGMMKRIPFKDGIFDAEALTRYSEDYLSSLVSHYRETGSSPRQKAERAGNAFLVHEIESRTERLIGRATQYVHETVHGMAVTLDPNGLGNVTKTDAKRILTEIADLADSDKNGVLDQFESAIAEAAFAQGRDLREPGVEAAIEREIDQASIHTWY
jgi:hypothetical protein